MIDVIIAGGGLAGHFVHIVPIEESCLTRRRARVESPAEVELAFLGESARALAELQNVLDRGFLCSRMLRRDPWLDSLRSHAEFEAIAQKSEHLEREMAETFVHSGADRLLGVATSHHNA